MEKEQDQIINNILKRLQQSKFRSHFHLSRKDLSYMEQKGIETIEQHAHDFIAKRLSPASPKNDGKQTPMRGHPVFIAQHATATCCRGCLEKWHKIEKGIPLTKKEQDYVVKVIMTWLKKECQPKD